ncbi:hypothetical protein K491DRAFT_753769 [Lophiostoma macrostomum CBS 122681]|uniref:Uncharacterized protein n=1 Tax=Lophiostoma macrostomum CBS 122681 TaxID=1314788 RepID=A0A6A6TPT3_9PLEO|nr:hypothetical protein K491DRAFT_753769 [Lophiostoma macrostomum CBS 122681]
MNNIGSIKPVAQGICARTPRSWETLDAQRRKADLAQDLIAALIIPAHSTAASEKNINIQQCSSPAQSAGSSDVAKITPQGADLTSPSMIDSHSHSLSLSSRIRKTKEEIQALLKKERNLLQSGKGDSGLCSPPPPNRVKPVIAPNIPHAEPASSSKDILTKIKTGVGAPANTPPATEPSTPILSFSAIAQSDNTPPANAPTGPRYMRSYPTSTTQPALETPMLNSGVRSDPSSSPPLPQTAPPWDPPPTSVPTKNPSNLQSPSPSTTSTKRTTPTSISTSTSPRKRLRSASPLSPSHSPHPARLLSLTSANAQLRSDLQDLRRRLDNQTENARHYRRLAEKGRDIVDGLENELRWAREEVKGKDRVIRDLAREIVELQRFHGRERERDRDRARASASKGGRPYWLCARGANVGKGASRGKGKGKGAGKNCGIGRGKVDIGACEMEGRLVEVSEETVVRSIEDGDRTTQGVEEGELLY